MKDLKFICVQPDDNYYTWQVNLWLESLKNKGLSDKAVVLIFTPFNREQAKDRWTKISDIYPESEFVFIADTENEVSKYLGIYIPISRPYCLWKYFEQRPEESEKAYFYCDSDILFLDNFNLEPFLEDDIVYLSDTNSYINATYFDSKKKDVRPDRLAEYEKIDVLGGLSKLIGISREVCELNNLNSGGAQYFFKNLNGDFWKKVMYDTLTIRTYLQRINKEYFINENKGFQSWCADMWGVLWNVWYRGQETKVIPELNFAWATDPIARLDTCTIFHNAGVAETVQGGVPYFYKAKYHQGADPFKDTQLSVVLNSEKSKEFCTWFYANKMKEMKDKYNLDY